jgi:hypothetical protein
MRTGYIRRRLNNRNRDRLNICGTPDYAAATFNLTLE